MLKVLEINLCIINYSESLGELAKETIVLFDKKRCDFEELFDFSFNDKVVVNYFDNIEEFRKFIFEIRGEEDSLPQYATGTYDREMVNAYINPKFQLKRLYTFSHELFHILYLKYVLKYEYSKRIVWYDEGMAQFMSGEKDWLNDEENFKNYYFKVRENTKNILNLNSLVHGESFVNNDYNGYDLSYLAIRYLSENLDKCQFKNLMYDFLEINKIGEDILEKMFSYYDEKFKNSDIRIK